MKAISLRLEIDQYKRLRLLSFAMNKPISTMIREAIDAYLKMNQQPKPGQEWFWSEQWQQAERQTEADLATGDYETFETMTEFLDSLE
jgi:predicted transcriptional regulator